MMDVARVAGVSHQTVSRVLNGSELVREETRERVLRAISSLGYRRNNAARALVTNRSGRIGVILADLGERGPSTLAVALQVAARRAGYEADFFGLPDLSFGTLSEAVDTLLGQGVEALIVGVTHRGSLAVVEGLQLAIPVVVVEGVTGDRPLTAGVAQRVGGRLATSHLLDHGHRQVAHLSGPLEWVEATERLEGWREAHERRRLAPGPQWSGDWTAASGYAAGSQIATDDSVTAIFVANDQMALGLLLALHELGRKVPGDISVVGFDDLPETAFFIPPLSTVRQDFAELARRAMRLVVLALGTSEDPQVSLIEPVLVERRSCAGPPGA